MISIAKKVIIYSMVGIMQLGLGTAILEASANQQQYAQHDLDRHKHEREKVRHEREARENHRHEQEMRRHRGESDRDWYDRQQRENERHDREMDWILREILDIFRDQ